MADNYPDIFDRPIPGQSLTDEPKNYPWEHPAQFSDLREARDRIFEGLTQEESVQQLYTMLRSNVPVEAIVRTVLFAGFTEGKFSVDVAEIAKPLLALYIIKMGLENNIPVVPFTDKVLSEEEEDIIRDEETLENMEETAPDKARFIKGEMFMEDFEGLANEEKSKMDAREKIRAKEAEMPTVESDGSFLELGGE